jgi:predicted acetyltransferase
MDAVGAISSYFEVDRDPERAERFLRNLPLERMHAAWTDGAIVGGAGAFPFQFSVPGGTVACAGVTVVGVYPTHRRRGVLREMMRAQLDDVRERGEPIAALWASEETIYGRYGYGIASWAGEIALPREYSAYAEPFERRGRVRFVEPEEALELFPPIWEAVRVERPAMFARSRDWWELRVLRDRDPKGGKNRYVALDVGAETVAYGIYRTHPAFAEGVSAAKLEVVEALGLTPHALAEMWRYLLDVDWTATVEAALLPPDHPLFLLLANPRRAKYRMGDGLWVRLVDVGEALSARSYRDGEPLVFEVRDAFCPWNDGRWRLADGRAERTEEASDLRLDAGALASAYLGGVSFAELRHALVVEELTDSAAARADAQFAWPLHPWCPEIF